MGRGRSERGCWEGGKRVGRGQWMGGGRVERECRTGRESQRVRWRKVIEWVIGPHVDVAPGRG